MDEKMEIRLVNPTEDGFLQKIDWNKAELEENVRSIVAAYQGLVYTEDTVSDAKNDRAALRKLLNEIEDRRKLVKKKCMEPYEVFESDLKDVTALIKEQISIIDGQVKEYENSVKEEKKARLQDVYTEAIGELAEVLPFERVFEAQYLNVSFKESKAATEIQEKIQRVKSDLAAIDALDSKYKLNAKDVYVRTLDMSQAKVTSQMKVEDMKKGNLDTEMELFLNEETGEYEMRPVADTTQRSIFDADYRDVTEPGPAGIEPDNGPEYIEHPELPGEVADEHALPGPVEEYEDADESVYDDSTGDNPEDTQFTDETDLDGAGDGTEITSGTEEDETDTEDDEYGYDEPEEEE